MRVIIRWHTPCQKESERNGELKKGSVGNEKGVNRNLLFVGFKFYVAACISANTISQVRRIETLRATFE